MDREQELADLYGPEIVKKDTIAPKGWMDRMTDTIAVVDSDDPDRRRKVERWVRRLAWMLDESIEIPVINRRIGFDGLVGLIPVVGDSATTVASLSVIVSGLATGASLPTITRMVINTVLDSVVGAVPVIGQLWDFVYKANTRNVRLLEADLADREATKRSSMKVLVLSVVVIAIVALALVMALAAVITWIFQRADFLRSIF